MFMCTAVREQKLVQLALEREEALRECQRQISCMEGEAAEKDALLHDLSEALSAQVPALMPPPFSSIPISA